MISIIGARGSISSVDHFLKKLERLSVKEQIIVQVFDADFVYGKKHLKSAALHALRAFKQKTQSTNSLAKEILLYAAGERQIKKAINKLGLKKTTKNIAFVFINIESKKSYEMHRFIQAFLKDHNFQHDDKVLEGDYDTLKRFGITDTEIQTVSQEKYGDLILERVALVDIIK
ncbi:MAG: KEOPS complex subunit Cgi121 [Candidatus Thermoplasmatota archaeon]